MPSSIAAPKYTPSFNAGQMNTSSTNFTPSAGAPTNNHTPAPTMSIPGPNSAMAQPYFTQANAYPQQQAPNYNNYGGNQSYNQGYQQNYGGGY